jgi:type IV pilus assembly protein PilF
MRPVSSHRWRLPHTHGWGTRARRWSGRWLPALLAAALLGACAAGGGAPGASADPITESDEPDARKRARIRLELATGYFEQGQTTVALDEIKQSLAADPAYVPAHVLRGLVYMELNDPRTAEDSFRRALQLNPRDPDALHNYGWFVCQQGRHREAVDLFARALLSPAYAGQARSYMAKGICELRMGQHAEAERSLTRSYEIDAGNPITGYNLAALLHRRGDDSRAQFYIRRLNNSELANAETLWLGIRVERRLRNAEAMAQLAQQLGRRFPQSPEWTAYQRGTFDE